MEIRRFGIGHRRPDGPPGTKGVRGGPIHTDERGIVAELAVGRGGSISPHSNPNLTYFLVIEGGGFVRVGDQTARVSAGDAVVWPPDVVHAAWAELTPMRVIVVEFTGADVIEPLLLGTGVTESGAGGPSRAADAMPSEQEIFGTPIARDGEPW